MFQIGQKRSNFNLSLKIAQMLKYQRSEFFVKCSTVHRLLNQYVKMAYGQNVRFLRFAVNGNPRLHTMAYLGKFGYMEIKTDFLAYFHHKKIIVMHTKKPDKICN